MSDSYIEFSLGKVLDEEESCSEFKNNVEETDSSDSSSGLEAALVFVENCGHAGKTVGEVMSGIVAKCIAAPKTKTKDLALQVTLMYVEIEKHDIVQEELMKGMEQKNPKVVSACIQALNTALKQFGNKVIGIKPMVKKIPVLLSDRDKTVRDEMKALVVEMYRWIGAAIEPHIASLQPVVQQELREAFGTNSGGAHPTRYLRSQQPTVAEVRTHTGNGVEEDEDEDVETGAGDSAEVDPYDLLDPVEILSKLPKDFYEKLDAKKWQERKEALDNLETLLKSAPKLEPGDYAELVRALKKVISKDTNVMLVAQAGRLLGVVAAGLRTKFQPYAVACIQAILDKFKEKKANVVAALREATDAIYPCTNLEAIMEDMLAAFENKNPSVKTEAALFMARALTHTQPAAFNKKLIKAYIPALLKLLESAEPTVREASAEALGTATKLVGEKNIAPHIGKIDNLKEQKIKEYADKAVIHVKIAAPKKEAKGKTASAPGGKGDAKPTAGSTQPKPVKRPGTAKSGANKVVVGKKAPAGRGQNTPPREQELSQEEVDARAEQLFTEDVLTGLSDSNWKTRLAAVKSLHSTVLGLSPNDTNAQILFRTLNRKPGLKDTNVQVLKARLEVAKYVSENFPISNTAANFVIQDIVNKLGEGSCSAITTDCLTCLSEASSLEQVANEALTFAMDQQKNPKVQSELFNWLAGAIKEFGFTMNVKPLIAHSKKAISATNPNVRAAVVNFLGVLSLYVGPSILNHFDGEKAATKQLISSELDKYANSSPPTPTRQVTKSSSKGSMGDEIEEPFEDAENEEEPAPVEDTRPRTDLAPLITEALIAEIGDKNWKVRNEGLEKLKVIITTSAPIKATLGELPPALAARLLDSNSKLAQTALQICESLATAMGSRCKQHVRTFFPMFIQAFGDNKQWIRQAAVACVDTWCLEAGGAHVAFDGEMVHEALKSGSPVLRTELFQWLAEKLPDYFEGTKEQSIYSEVWSLPLEDTCNPREISSALWISGVLDRNRIFDGGGIDFIRWTKRNNKRCYFISIFLPPKSFPREELAVCVPILYACVEDRAAEVRKRAADCVLPFMLHLGYEPMFKQLDKLKPGSKSVLQAALDKARPSLPVQPLPKGKKEESRGVKSAGALKKEGEKKAVAAGKTKGIAKSASSSGRSKKDDEDTSPLLPNNNAKNQRIIDDQKLKVLKWNFTSPREEFFELLKEQMASAGVNKQLIANMFHSDFRYHLKAIESLAEDLLDNGSALVSNLDLVLKWLTLRFFDTNPSVILKGLDYLSAVFSYLMEIDYTMAEYEANCFIPYLVLKVGDPKDTVRNGVKALFKQICVVYSVTKLFGYLMEGLKSKNARQRAECLECIGHLIETYGSSVLSPSAAAALKELARHIGDRDNGVRSAALNCIANAYFLEGEKVYKMIGQISDKDLSLLEERIKRAGKTRSAENRRSTVVPLTATGKPVMLQNNDIVDEQESRRVISVEAPPGADYEDEEPEEEPQPPPIAASSEPKVISGPFGLDPELIAQLDAQAPTLRKSEVPEVDLKFLDDPIPVPTIRGGMPITTSRPNIVAVSPSRHTLPTSLPHAPPPSKSAVDDSQLADTIHSIASPDLNSAIRALSLITGALGSGRGGALAAHEERLVRAVAAQVRRLRCGAHSPRQAISAYRCIATLLNTFYECEGCGRCVGESAVGELLGELLRVLCGAALTSEPDADKLVRVLNNVCVRLLEHSARTSLLCALISLLHDSIGVVDPAYPRYQDLLMKCFWKTLKMINTWDLDSIDYDSVLFKIHLFYKAYPNSYWKKNTEISDTPHRTVKTLVHNLVKMKGTSITNHLTQIPDVQESDLYPYLLKVFKQLKLEDKPTEAMNGTGGGSLGGAVPGFAVGVAPVNVAAAARLPRPVHDELAAILKRIGAREHSQDALSQLYDLRERHPELDIWTFMQGSSFYFRNYVERGLRDVAEQRRRGLAALSVYKHDFKRDNIDINNENEEKSHLVFLERLRVLQYYLQYNARNSVAVKLVTKASQWRKIATQGRRRKGRGALNLRNSERQSFAKAGLKTDPPPQQTLTTIDNKTLSDQSGDSGPPRHNIDPQLEDSVVKGCKQAPITKPPSSLFAFNSDDRATKRRRRRCTPPQTATTQEFGSKISRNQSSSDACSIKTTKLAKPFD
ncbi:Protein mini spindles [Eumeta japonica]|uniref:Protein mini spindles n=1 Tax=Eumeta variegata TaxID=151549 RepID=A0A4C1VYM3_EUMVA|nr:Protein mini spindles [Eumeta japonica]